MPNGGESAAMKPRRRRVLEIPPPPLCKKPDLRNGEREQSEIPRRGGPDNFGTSP